jgi:hypothetical protein
LLKNRDNPDKLMCSATQRNKPLSVFRSSHSTNPNSTVTKYFHWRWLKQGRKISRYWRRASDRHTIGLGMVPLREFGFSKPIILGLSHARSIQFLKCKDSELVLLSALSNIT